jgi:preprotein translocase subunit SecE
MLEKIQNFFMGSYDEFKKIIWPSKKIVINHTVMVVVSIIVSMAIIAVLDFGLFSGVQRLINGY